MSGNRLTGLARTLRRGQTTAEAKLWSILRNRQLEGLKFRRQQPIGGYVADFCCEELRLIIELDGGQHAERQEQDRARTPTLEDMNYTVLRFWNVDVAQGPDGVVDEILSVVQAAQLTRHRSG
jgi:very-short-patch-repair endonuclease